VGVVSLGSCWCCYGVHFSNLHGHLGIYRTVDLIERKVVGALVYYQSKVDIRSELCEKWHWSLNDIEG